MVHAAQFLLEWGRQGGAGDLATLEERRGGRRHGGGSGRRAGPSATSGDGGQRVPGAPAPSPTPEGRRALGALGGLQAGICLFQQWRLLPYLAAAYALDHFSKSLFLDLVELQQGLLGKDRSARQVRVSAFLHSVYHPLNFAGLGQHRFGLSFKTTSVRGFAGTEALSDVTRGLCPLGALAAMGTCQARVHIPDSQGCADTSPGSRL